MSLRLKGLILTLGRLILTYAKYLKYQEDILFLTANVLHQAKVERDKPFYVSQFEGLKKFVNADEYGLLKITMCAPEWFHLRHGEYAYSKDVYRDDGMIFFYDIKNSLDT